MGTKVNVKSLLNLIWITLIYSIIFFVPLVYSNQFIYPYKITKILLFELILYLTIFFSLLSLNKKVIRSFNLNIIDFTIIIYILFLFFLTGSFLDSNYYLPNLTLLMLFYFLLRLIFSFQINKYDKLINGYRLFIFSCLLECIIVFYEIIFKIFPLNSYERYKPDIYGTLGNPNLVAIFLAACLPFLFLLFQRTNSKIKKSIYIISFIAFISVIVLSLSRGTWVALFIGLTFYFTPSIKRFYFKIKEKIILKFGLVIVFVVLLFFSSVALIKINENSIYGRIFLWKITSLMIQGNIITGIGYGNFPLKYLDYQEKFFSDNNNSNYLFYADNEKQPNNEYLLILAETGIVGLILFFLIYLAVFIEAKKILRSNNVGIQSMGKASLSSIFIILVHGFFDNPLHALPVYLILFFNVAVISHLSNKIFKLGEVNCFYNRTPAFFNKLGKTFTKQNIFKQIIRITSIIIILLMPLLIYHTICKANAYYHWQKGIEYAIMNRWKKAIGEYNFVLDILPENGQIQFNLGAAYLNDHNPKQAVYYLNESLKTYKDKNIYISLGFAYWELSNLNKSLYIFEELEKKFPNLLMPHLLLGKVYLEKGSFKKSKEEFEFVIKTKPKFDNEIAKDVKNEAARILKIMDINNY